jgi:hypothetical protein
LTNIDKVVEKRLVSWVVSCNTEDVRGERRQLHHEKLYYLYSSKDVINKNGKIGKGQVQYMRNACRILAGKSKEKRLFTRPRHRCAENIKFNVKGVGHGGCS